MSKTKQVIATNKAPKAIGPYSQAIRSGNTVYLAGQIALTANNEIVQGDFSAQVKQVFQNLSAVAGAAGGTLNDIVKLTIYLVDFQNYAEVNSMMMEFFSEPYPARATIAVSALPKGVDIEIDAVMVID